MTGHRSYLLESTRRDFRPKPFPREPAVMVARESPDGYQRCRRLWQEVGQGFWMEREDWSDADWRRHLALPAMFFGVVHTHSADLGFFEVQWGKPSSKIEGVGLLSP